MGTNVILGMGNFSAICWISGLSKGELWDDLLFSEFVICFSCEKIKIPALVTVMIIKSAIEMSKNFQKLRCLGGFVGGMGWGVSCGGRLSIGIETVFHESK
jgi:hypothetical protein